MDLLFCGKLYVGEQHFVRRLMAMCVFVVVSVAGCYAQNFTVGNLNYTVTSTTVFTYR
jgi:hypothetical protein